MDRVELNEGSYAFVLAQVALLNCEVAGMQAENTHRLSCGNSVAYGADEFAAVRQVKFLHGMKAARQAFERKAA